MFHAPVFPRAGGLPLISCHYRAGLPGATNYIVERDVTDGVSTLMAAYI
jgi:hypothetical protein